MNTRQMNQGEDGLRAEPTRIRAEKSCRPQRCVSGLSRSDKIQGEAGLRAEPVASGLTIPTTSEMPKRFGAKRQK
jgi:hypothetical protein